MVTAALMSFTIEDWLAFAQANPESRTELVDGEILHISPETASHSRVKFLVVLELELSPSNRLREMSRKLLAYFRKESVIDYLVVNPAERTADHYARDETGAPMLLPTDEGIVVLRSIGLRLDVSRFFG